MKSLEAIRISKLGKKKVPSAESAYTGGENPSLKTKSVESDGSDFRGIKDGVKDSGPFPTAKTTGSSLDILKAHKASGGKVPSAKMPVSAPMETTVDIESSPVPTTYSPIQNYLKKRGK